MESGNSFRWRKQAPKPIETRRSVKREEEKNSRRGATKPVRSSILLTELQRVVIATMGCKTRIQPDVAKANLGRFLLKHPSFSSLQVAIALSQKVVSRTTMGFSNMVGPQEEIGFYGHPMAFLAAASYGQSHVKALLINFRSYIGKMSAVLSVDEETIPDPHQLCGDIAESLEPVRAAVLTKALA